MELRRVPRVGPAGRSDLGMLERQHRKPLPAFGLGDDHLLRPVDYTVGHAQQSLVEVRQRSRAEAIEHDASETSGKRAGWPGRERLVQVHAERVPGVIDVDPVITEIGRPCPAVFDDDIFTNIEVTDLDVEVDLLRKVGVRPSWGLVASARVTLEPEVRRLAAVVSELDVTGSNRRIPSRAPYSAASAPPTRSYLSG